MIYVCGDTHGKFDIEKIFIWEKVAKPTENDFLIILGDWGAVWYGDKKDERLISYWNNKPYKVLFIDGNHENFDALLTYPIVTFCGSPARQIADNIFWLLRGMIYTIEEKKIFTFGGAHSVDKYCRTPKIDWWPQEMPSPNEYNIALENLEKVGFEVDYILTHTADATSLYKINPYFETDEITTFLYFLKYKYNIKYKHHYFGHYHIDKGISKKETALYNYVAEIEKNIWY